MQERITGRITRLIRLSAGYPAVSARGAASPRQPDTDWQPGGDWQSGTTPDPGAGWQADPEREPDMVWQPAAAWRPRPARARTGPGQARASFRSHLTARGALLGMFVLVLVACLLAAWREVDVLAGLGYCAGCVLTPVYARREAQLRIVLSAPAVFLLADVITQALTAQGNTSHGSVLSVLEGTGLTLADAAPWLFAGTAACVVVAATRGLPQCVRDLRAGPAGAARLRAGAGARPEPGGTADRGRRGESGLRGHHTLRP
jgi:hypothetical protein